MTNHYDGMISELCHKDMNTFNADELLLWQYDIYRTFYRDPAEEAENSSEIGTGTAGTAGTGTGTGTASSVPGPDLVPPNGDQDKTYQ